eukprot:PhM_4_TR11659/c1_g1_i5/m.16545
MATKRKRKSSDSVCTVFLQTSTMSQCNATQDLLFQLLENYNALRLQYVGNDAALAVVERSFSQTFVAGTEGNPKCNCCGKCIAQHKVRTSIPDTATMMENYTIWKGTHKTAEIPDSIRRNVTKYPCCVCNAPNAVCAHLAKSAEVLREIPECDELEFTDISNFLPLCGSCHDAFDNHYLTFVAHDDGWQPLYCSKYPFRCDIPRRVTIPTNPHRRVMHSHALRCIHNPSVDRVGGDDPLFREDVEEWLNNTTPKKPTVTRSTWSCTVTEGCTNKAVKKYKNGFICRECYEAELEGDTEARTPKRRKM